MTDKTKSKNAFTLAEVLITLVIIGVVAALTISAVINTYVERSTISKVKKGLSTIAQAKKLAETQHGPIEGWDFGGWSEESEKKFFSYLKPYIVVIKDCGTRDESCYQSDGVYYLNGTIGNYNYNSNNLYYKFVLSDGGVMIFAVYPGKCVTSEDDKNNVCATFVYDVNGVKSPNTYGHDIFAYTFTPDGVFPNLQNDCNKNGIGRGCSNYIIKNDNMNYLH